MAPTLTDLRHPRGVSSPLAARPNEEIIMRVRVKILWYHPRLKREKEWEREKEKKTAAAPPTMRARSARFCPTWHKRIYDSRTLWIRLGIFWRPGDSTECNRTKLTFSLLSSFSGVRFSKSVSLNEIERSGCWSVTPVMINHYPEWSHPTREVAVNP